MLRLRAERRFPANHRAVEAMVATRPAGLRSLRSRHSPRAGWCLALEASDLLTPNSNSRSTSDELRTLGRDADLAIRYISVGAARPRGRTRRLSIEGCR